MIYLKPLLVLIGIAGTLGIVLALADYYLANYGVCKLIINGDREFEVKGGNTLLAGLLDKKIFLPSACGGRATCGFCKCQVKRGGGPLLPTETPFLSKQEINNNVRMACQIKVKADIEISIPESLLEVKEFKTRLEKISDLTYDIKAFLLKLEGPDTISFKPGQYVQFQIPNTIEYRAYSISSLPSQNRHVELISRLVPEGVCTTYMHNILKQWDGAIITGPYGEFYLREDSHKDIICVAGGSGLAPIKSIIFHLFEKGTGRKVIFFFGARSLRDLYYRKEFEKLALEHENFTYIPALSSPALGDNWTGEKGYIHLCIPKYIKNGINKEAYLCGPPVMIDSAIPVLHKLGISDKDIYFDKF